LEAYYLRPELETKLKNQEGTLADFNLKRAFHLKYGASEILTSRAQLIELSKKIVVSDTNFDLIRIGAKNDGGYLVPDDLSNIKSLFSPGVDAVSDFELSFASRGVPCFLADASVKSPPVTHEKFHFQKKFVHQGPDTGDYINFNSWVLDNEPNEGYSALQMDIEGAEWGVILGMSERVLKNFRFMVIEFHGMHQMAFQLPFQTISSVFSKLLTEFEIVHVHANNAESSQTIYDIKVPPLAEVTLVRRDLVTRSSPKHHSAHASDAPNVPGLPDVQLGNFWSHKGAFDAV
jgi:hypothetical protein